MELIRTLKEILNPKYIEPVTKPGFFELEEIQAKGYPKTLIRYNKFKAFLPCDFDKSDSNKLFEVFNVKKPGLTNICDYILFFEKKKGGRSVLFVFLCNLKSTNTKRSSEQIETSKIFAEYIVHMAKRHLGYKRFQVWYRALVFWTPKLALKKSMHIYTHPRKSFYTKLGNSGILQMRLRAGENCYPDFIAK